MAKILIIDDISTERELMKASLRPKGHVIIEAVDGQAGIDLAGSEKPHLILLDVVLPKVDGFQVCRKIKKNPDTSQIPVILVTTKSQESDKFWGLKQGASSYLTKPFNEDELLAAVNQCLS